MGNRNLRDLNIYQNTTRNAYIISHGNAITLRLGTIEEGDYLHLSVVSGPGRLEKDCWINLPSWCDFIVSGLENGDISHSGERMLLKIPKGPPLWQLKIMQPGDPLALKTPEYVTIGNSESVERGQRMPKGKEK